MSWRCRWPIPTRATCWCCRTRRRTRRCSRRSSSGARDRYGRVLFLGGGGTDLLSSQWSVTPLASDRFQVPEYESAAQRLSPRGRAQGLRIQRSTRSDRRPRGLSRPGLDIGVNDDLQRHPVPRQGAGGRTHVPLVAAAVVPHRQPHDGDRPGDRDLDERRRPAGRGAAGGRHGPDRRAHARHGRASPAGSRNTRSIHRRRRGGRGGHAANRSGCCCGRRTWNPLKLLGTTRRPRSRRHGRSRGDKMTRGVNRRAWRA